MKAKELMLGNLLTLGEVESIQGKWVTFENKSIKGLLITEDELQPIPLTEEWLVKFGFEVSYSMEIRCYCVKGIEAIRFNLNSFYYNTHEIKHVHQLQNLYFALTDEELEIKQIVTENV